MTAPLPPPSHCRPVPPLRTIGFAYAPVPWANWIFAPEETTAEAVEVPRTAAFDPGAAATTPPVTVSVVNALPVATLASVNVPLPVFVRKTPPAKAPLKIDESAVLGRFKVTTELVAVAVGVPVKSIVPLAVPPSAAGSVPPRVRLLLASVRLLASTRLLRLV